MQTDIFTKIQHSILSWLSQTSSHRSYNPDAHYIISDHWWCSTLWRARCRLTRADPGRRLTLFVIMTHWDWNVYFNVTNLSFGCELNYGFPEIQFWIRVSHFGWPVSGTAVLPSILFNPSYTDSSEARSLELVRRRWMVHWERHFRVPIKTNAISWNNGSHYTQ